MPAHKKPANTTRSETVTVRLDPKLHYLAGIAAREMPSRSLSAFIEWAVRRTLTDAEAMRECGEPMPGTWPAPSKPLWMETLWDVDEADRFYKLAETCPGLLTVSEQRLWKLFDMHMKHTKKEPTIEAFRKFWNSSSIDTSHLKEGRK